MPNDASFTQATIAVLVATMLALMLQARLVGSHADHPISTRGRAALAAAEIFFTTTFATVAIAVAYSLLQRLAGGAPLGTTEKRGIALLLLLLLTGLGVITVLSRIVPYLWKSPEPGRPYLEPELDTDFLGGLWLAVLGALATSGSLLQLFGQFGAQWLVLTVDGAFVVAFAVGSSALSSKFSRSYARWCRARLLQHGYTEHAVHAALPGGARRLPVKAYRPGHATEPVRVTGHDAWQLKRHHEGALRQLLTGDPNGYERAPTKLHLRARVRHREIELTTRSRLGSVAGAAWRVGHGRRPRERRPWTVGLPGGARRRETRSKPRVPRAGFVSLSEGALVRLDLDGMPRPRSPGS
jgi:hypothetical protein